MLTPVVTNKISTNLIFNICTDYGAIVSLDFRICRDGKRVGERERGDREREKMRGEREKEGGEREKEKREGKE